MIRLKDTKTTPHGHVQLLCALRAEDHIIPHIEKAPEIGKKRSNKGKEANAPEATEATNSSAIPNVNKVNTAR